MSDAEKRIDRLQQAKDISGNPLFNSILEGLKKKYYDALVSSAPGSQEATNNHCLLVAVHNVESEIKSCLIDEAFMKRSGIM